MILSEGFNVMFGTVLQLTGGSCLAWVGWQLYKRYFPESKVKALQYCFKNAGLMNKNGDKPNLIKHEKREKGDFFIFTIPKGKSFEDFERKKQAIEHIVGNIDLWYEENRLYIRSNTEPIPNKVKYGDIPDLGEYGLGIPIGQGLNKFVVHDLAENVAHFLIAGTTRYGKSNLLNVIISALIEHYSTDKVKLNLIDLKDGAEFIDYKDFDHVENFIDSPEYAKMVFQELRKEKERRMKYVKSMGKKNIKGLNMPYLITIIDEYAALEDDVQEDATFLLQQGGAAGIVFMIATQYPRNDVVNKLISVNCDVRISLHLKDASASRVVLNNDLASQLPAKPGRAIYQYGDDIEVQIPLWSKPPQIAESAEVSNKGEIL